MAGNTVDLAQQFQGSSPGASMVGGNTRVKGQPGLLATQADAIVFGDGTGNWVAPNTRTRILGVFMISASSQGIEATSNGPVPIVVTTADASIRSL
jgi:hypothetical protein